MAIRRFERVAVLKGGPSSEREVSLRSGSAIAGGLRAAGYEVVEVDITGHEVVLPSAVDAVFIALHGAFGEDGLVQSILDARKMPYTGSGAVASRVAFDKVLSKQALVAAGIPTAGYEVIRNESERTLPLPVVTKPPREGSSVGVELVLDEPSWSAAFARTAAHDPEVMVENYIPGRELTVGILAGRALPLVEIVAPEAWYDYEAKYTSGASEYLVPAPVASAVAARCAVLAEQTFEVLGCRGLGRVDFRMDADEIPMVLEMNTIPGFTETSLLPKAAAAAGIDFSTLCARIMETATVGD